MCSWRWLARSASGQPGWNTKLPRSCHCSTLRRSWEGDARRWRAPDKVGRSALARIELPADRPRLQVPAARNILQPLEQLRHRPLAALESEVKPDRNRVRAHLRCIVTDQCPREDDGTERVIMGLAARAVSRRLTGTVRQVVRSPYRRPAFDAGGRCPRTSANERIPPS